MSLPVILDAEALVGGWLREHADIVALDANVAGSTPDSLTRPWIRVTQIAAADAGHGLERAVDYTVQCDCYAGTTAMRTFNGQSTAATLARATRSVLKSMQGTVASGAVISRVRFSSHLRSPDTTTEPAMQRVILLAELLMHPA